MKRAADQEIIEKLQKQILNLQGHKAQSDEGSKLGLGAIESSFPGRTFPRGAIHELISLGPEAESSTNGFISVILSKLMKQGGTCVWISTRRRIFPPALKIFGIEPERILFVDAWKLKDALWTIEEALKCDALSAVIGEIHELSFNDSRRLQLAVEKSKVTGFIHRHHPKTINTVACVTRWKIDPVPSTVIGKMPGLGFPQWDVELLKVRNGHPGKWRIRFGPGGIDYISEIETGSSKPADFSKEQIVTPETYERKTA